MKKQKEIEIVQTDAYSLFVYAIRTQITRDYYLRRLRTFFDFITLLPNSRIENRCNRFAAIAIKDHNWTVGKIVGFLQFQKGRVEREEITAANRRRKGKKRKSRFSCKQEHEDSEIQAEINNGNIVSIMQDY